MEKIHGCSVVAFECRRYPMTSLLESCYRPSNWSIFRVLSMRTWKNSTYKVIACALKVRTRTRAPI